MAYDYRNAANYLSDVLGGLSQGFLSAPRNGPPLAGLGIGLQNANQLMAQRQMQAQQDLRDQLLRSQLEQQQKAQAEADATKKAQASAWRGLIGQPDPNATPKFIGGAGSGPSSFQQPAAPTPSPLLSGFSPDQISFLQSFGNVDPGGALSMVGEQAFASPKAPTVNDGMQYNPKTGTWDPIPGWLDNKKAIAAAGRAPVQPPQPSLVTLYAPDGTPKSLWNYQQKEISGLIGQGYSAEAPKKATKLIDLTPEEIKARGLPIGTVAQLNPDTNELDIKNKGAEGPGGMFDTKSIPGQALNFLAAHQQDPSSLEYAIAYAVASKPTTQFLPDGTVNTFTPDVSMFNKPTFTGPQQAVDAGSAAVLGQSSAAPQPSAQSAAAPGGAPAPQQPNPNIQTQQIPGGSVSRVQGGYQTPQDVQTLKKVEAEVGSIRSSLENFRNVVKQSKMPDFLDAATGGHFEGGKKLNAAWAAAALQTKAEALFNLGVLNGPDLPLIQRVLTDPSTVGGAVSSTKAYEAGIDQVLNLIDERVKAFQEQYGPKTPNGQGATAPAPAVPSIDDLKKKYNITPVNP